MESFPFLMEFEFPWVKLRLNTDKNCHLDCCVVYFLHNEDELMRIRTTKSIAFCCYCAVAAAAKSLQSCPTLCDPIDGSPPASFLPGDSPGKNTGVGCHFLLQCMKVKSESEVTQSCSTLSDPMDCSLPGSSVHGVFQARVLEWGAIAFAS